MAGCQGGGGDGDDGTENGTPDGTPEGPNLGGATARYSKWIYSDANQGSQVFALSLDWQAIPNLEGSQSTPSGDQNLQEDPLATLPMSWLFVGAFAVGLGLPQVGLNAAAEENGPTEYVHIVSGGIVLEGSYEMETYSQSVEQAGGSEVEEYDGYTLYEMSTNSGNAAVALSSETIVTVQGSSDSVDDPMARTKGLIDAGAGNKTPLTQDSEEFSDLMTSLPNRAVMGTAFVPTAKPLNESTDGQGSQTGLSQTDLDGEAKGIASSADVSQDGMTSSVAIRYASESEVNDKSAIEGAIGSMSSEQTVTIDGSIAVIEGTYDSIPNISN